MKNKKLLFSLTALSFVGIFILAIFLYKSSESKRIGFLASENSEIFVRDYAPQYGDPDAKVYVIEFLDPECESCRAFYPQVKDILNDYKGKVKLIVRYAAFHKNSRIAIHALEAARKQGKYWQSLELLFKYQPNWGNHHNPQPDLIFYYLPEAGVDVAKLKEDMKDPKIAQIIAQDTADLKKLNVRGTPTFFVNGKPLANFGMQYLRQAIEAEIKAAY